MKLNKIVVRLFVIFNLAGFGDVALAKTSSEPQPNIIIIMVDTLRADYLGSYGFKGDISSNIDKLASESVRFTNAISNAPWTKPAIASLFTSLHPQTHRVTDHLGMHWKKVSKKVKSSVLSDEAITLAEVLRSAGYDTVGLVANDFLIRRFGYQQGFDRYFEPKPHNDVFSATPLLNKTLRLLRKGKIKQPFFVYLHFMDVHGPFQCRGGDFEKLSNSPSLGEDIILTKKQRRRIPHELGYKIPWRASEKAMNVRNWRNCYAAGVRKFDRRLGPFLKSIREIGIMENTIIILTSDHGEELYDHKGWAHSHTLYNELVKIPLLVRMPGGKFGGRTVQNSVSLLDVMPTLMRQAGVEGPYDGLAGRNLTPLLTGKKGFKDDWTYATATRHYPGMISLQNKKFKMIWNHPKGKPLLFNLNRDPMEKKNLTRKKSRVVTKLKGQVKTHLKDLKKRGNLLQKTTTVSDELLEKLKTLGYMQ